MALDILRGTRYAENTPIALEVPQLDMFDWRQLRHWNLSESALPRGSIIVNREFSFWDLRYYAIGVLALILAQSVLISRGVSGEQPGVFDSEAGMKKTGGAIGGSIHSVPVALAILPDAPPSGQGRRVLALRPPTAADP
jgi:hypothetical protein